jgi:hypothetical protein
VKSLENILLVSVFITNKSLNPAGDLGHSRNGNSLERLEIFLSSLESWSKFQTSSPYFFIELDDEFVCYRDLVASEITKSFIDPKVEWRRLLYYKEWFEISKIFTEQNVDLITLIANDDHAYVHTESKPFQDFSKEVLALSTNNKGRAIGDLTHFPGSIRMLSYYSTFHPKKGTVPRTQKVETIHGCCLVTPKLFSEWWESDFTNGKRIPRPDNPFGPSVQFAPALALTPTVEIMRHMDGYGEGSRISRKYNLLRPSHRLAEGVDHLESEKLVVSPWVYGLWPSKPNSYNALGTADLYRMFPQSNLRSEHFRVDLSRLILAYQKAYAPELSRELILKEHCSNLYLLALNITVLTDFSTFINFLIWSFFDLPNKIAIKMSMVVFGETSNMVRVLQRIRNRIFQHLGVRLLKVTSVFSNLKNWQRAKFPAKNQIKLRS